MSKQQDHYHIARLLSTLLRKYFIRNSINRKILISVTWNAATGDRDIYIRSYEIMNEFVRKNVTYCDSVIFCLWIWISGMMSWRKIGRSKLRFWILSVMSISKMYAGSTYTHDRDLYVILTCKCYLSKFSANIYRIGSWRWKDFWVPMTLKRAYLWMNLWCEIDEL